MKKIFNILLALFAVVCLSFGLAACNGEENGAETGGGTGGSGGGNGSDEKYTVTVTCGAGGDYSLSPEAESYEKNSSVTLTVTPETDYVVDEVLVNESPVSLKDSKYTMTVTGNMTVNITFKQFVRVFDDKYVGKWNPNVGAGTLGGEITIREGDLTFDGADCSVTEADGVYSFTHVDEEGTATKYSVRFEEIYGEKNLLVMSYTDSAAHESFTVYYLKDGVDYFTFNAVEGSLWQQAKGYWDSQNVPLEITATGFKLSGVKGIVMAVGTDSASLNSPVKVLADGDEYDVAYIKDNSPGGTGQLIRITLKSSDGTLTFMRAPDPEKSKVPQHAGTYKNEAKDKTVVVDAEGNFNYCGTVYELSQFDVSGTQEIYSFVMDGKNYAVDFLKKDSKTVNYLWIRCIDGNTDEGEYFYSDSYPFEITYKVDFTNVDQTKCTYEFSASTEPKADGSYAAGTVLTIKITANPGYKISLLYLNQRAAEDFTAQAKNKTEYTLTYTIPKDFYDWYSSKTIRVYVTFKAAPATSSVSYVSAEPVCAGKGENV